jgi:hypothetical protein
MRFRVLHFDRHANLHRSVVVFGAVAAVMASAAFGLNAGASVAEVMVVDMIPEVLSGEDEINSEPNLAVNPANPSQIAASAWMPEPMGGKTTPVFISVDGGKTWSCRSTIPVNQITCDKTLQFGGMLNMLYLTTLQNNYDLIVCRSNRLAKNPMAPVGQRPGWIDQPYIATGTINKKDRVFIGCNDWKGPKGETATIVRSLDGTGNPRARDFTAVPIEFDDPLIDSSEIRPAISADGNKVYAVFNRVISIDGNTRKGAVILVRDDNGGNSGPSSFAALRDQNGVAGFPVVKARTFLFDDDCPALLGRDRLGGDLAIAVDPQNANTVCLVWGELVAGKPTLHVTRSDDSGATWSGSLRTVTNAKNPGLAMNANKTLAFLYQQVATSSGGEEIWSTNLERTKDNFKNKDTKILSWFPVSEIKINNGQPQLGDYLNLMAVGNDFYGIFSASNVPDLSRFCCGVTFQRRFKNGKLLDLHGGEVDPSIDPFFFRVTDN